MFLNYVYTFLGLQLQLQLYRKMYETSDDQFEVYCSIIQLIKNRKKLKQYLANTVEMLLFKIFEHFKSFCGTDAAFWV